jgi:hypothetical protein
MIKHWASLKYFKPDSKVDNWGDPTKIDPFLLLFLDEFRDALGSPLIVTSGYRGGDPAQHGVGRAVDVVAPKFRGSLFDLYLMAERFNFSGIGIYTGWYYQGKRTIGLHLDTRLILGSNSDALKGARWLCVRPGLTNETPFSEGIKIPQKYLPLDHKHLKEYGVI